MKILGIDSGTRNFGLCVLEDYNLILSETFKTEGKDFQKQLKQTYEKVKYIFNKYEIDIIAIEEPVGSGNITGGMNRIVGAIMLLGNCVLYKPNTVKLIVTGSGKASKSDVDFHVIKHLNLSNNFKFSSDHASDAAGVGITHLIKKGINRND